MFDIEIRKIQMTYHESIIKSLRKQIKWSKAYIGLCIFNTLSFVYNGFEKSNSISILYFIGCLIWVVLIFLTISNIKNQKIQLKNSIESYNEELKIIDYPKYLKEQRTLKLKKLKKAE